MKEEDKVLNEKVSRLLSKTKQHSVSLDFNSRLMRRIQMLNDIKVQKGRYFKRAIIMVIITVVLGLLIMSALSGLDQLFVGEANHLNEIIQVCLLSIILMLGGLILYVGNTFWEFRKSSLA